MTLARETQRISDRARGIIAVTACGSIAGMGLGFVFPVLTLTMERWETPEAVIGLNSGMFALSALLFSPLVPRFLGRFGVMRFLVACNGVMIACNLAFKAFETLWLWFPLRFIGGCANNGLFVTSEIWVSEIASNNNRGRTIGLYSTSLTAGFLMGPLLLLVTGTEGWLPYLAGSALIAVATLPLALARGREPKFEEASTGETLAMVKVTPTLILGGLMFGLLEASMFGFFPILGLRLGLSHDQAPLMVIALSAGNLCCQLPIGWLADHIDKRLLLAIGAFLSLVFALCMPLVGSAWWILFPLLFLWGGVVVGLYTLALAALGDQFRGTQLAAANAALGTFYGFGAIIGPALSGTAMQFFGPLGLTLSLAVFSGLYAVLSLYRLSQRLALRRTEP